MMVKNDERIELNKRETNKTFPKQQIKTQRWVKNLKEWKKRVGGKSQIQCIDDGVKKKEYFDRS